MRPVSFLLMSVAMVCKAWSAQGEITPFPDSLEVVRIHGDLDFTGAMTDPRWELARGVWAHWEVDPGENVPASQRTLIKALYNDDYVYFGFHCYDSNMSALRANISDRDRLWDDDYTIVLLDTYGDDQRTYEFFVNPFGIQADAMMTGGNEDPSFDAIWYAKAVRFDSSWVVEYAIPFKSLRFPSRQIQRWKILVGRSYPRDNRKIFSWNPIDRNNPCLTCQGWPMVGIEGIEATNSFEVLPYALSSQNGALRDRDDPVAPFHDGPVMGRAGAGVKYSPNPDLVFEAVVNPDFSQVESDAQQISVNTTFALFYQEKRPFFLEGADLFQGRLNTFYSRTINNPTAAAKVTGKSGSLSFSYLLAADRNSVFFVPGEESSSFVNSTLRSTANVARAKYALDDDSFVGLMAQARNTGPGSNYVGGVDWNYRFGSNYFRGEAFYAVTKELNDPGLLDAPRMFGSTPYNAALNGETYDGIGIRGSVERSTRDYFVSAAYQDLSPTFQAQNGFVTRNNNRSFSLSQNYQWYFTDTWVDRVYVWGEEGLQFNYDGVRKERYVVFGLGMNMKSQTNFNLGYLALNQEVFRNEYFPNIPRAFISINSRPASEISVYLNAEVGSFIFRDTPPEMGEGHNLSLTLNTRPTSRLKLDATYARGRLSAKSGGRLFFDGQITRGVVTYQFTPEIFLRAIGEYNSFSTSFSFYPLFSYKLNPFTIFYAGMTNDATNFGDPHNFVTTTRQFFVKIQYLWRS